MIFPLAHLNDATLDGFDTRRIPFGVAAICFVLQILRGFRHLFYGHNQRRSGDDERGSSWVQRLKTHVERYGGYTIYAFMLARLLGTVSLVSLSAIQTQRLEECHWTPGETGLGAQCPEYLLSLTFAYASCLAAVSLVSRTYNTFATRCNVVILFTAFAVYTYRDLWPLATYTESPKDAQEGRMLWAKIAILGVTAVIIPLLIPRRYVPVDPKNPMNIVNKELTASWISRLTFSYMNSIIVLGSKVSHIEHGQLPPLSDRDWASVQRKQAFPHIDAFSGAKRRHLFFGLLRAFRKDYTIMCISIVISSATAFAAPVGINRVLNYLQNGDAGSDNVKPWFWVAWLFFGPVFVTISTHCYDFYDHRTRVHIEAVITQLVFEHSFRIRLKAEASGDDASTEATAATSSTHTIASSVLTANIETDQAVVDGEHPPRILTESAFTVVGLSEDLSESSQPPSSGKGKAKDTSEEPQPQPAKTHTGDPGNLLGKINNFVTSDLSNILEGNDFMNFAISIPLQLILSSVFLFKVLGWSSIVGLVIAVALSPVGEYVGKNLQELQIVKMRMTDARVQAITEAVGILRMVKLFGWEEKIVKRIDEKREEELMWMWKVEVFKLVAGVLGVFIPTLTMMMTFFVHTVVMKQDLNASTIFSSMSVFAILRSQLNRVSWQTTLMIQGKVSLDRVSDFMQNVELLDTFAGPRAPVTDFIPITENDTQEDRAIGFSNATFAWSAEEEDGDLTPSSRTYRLRVEGDLFFKLGALNTIVGPTGSGKTSMLMALLGEMHFIPSNRDSWFNLPRSTGVAYVAQEAWVQNATIRENILFQSSYDEERYKKVIHQCALEHDLDLFEAGDATEVGERGLTLSGGQKARVTLARAIYSPAKILLLDDVLAALDVHTSAWIANECLKGDLVRGRTVLLVTHNVALVGPIAKFVVSVGLDGKVKSQGTDFSALLATDPALASGIEDEVETLNGLHKEESYENSKSHASTEGKLIVAEEVVHGHVSWKSLNLLLSGLGGKDPITFAMFWISGVITYLSLSAVQTWFLGVWGAQYETHPPSEVNLLYYNSIVVTLNVVFIIVFTSANFYYCFRSIAASRTIHAQLVRSVFGSTLRWLDETPTARIIARCTQDINIVDNEIATSLYWVVDQFFGMASRLAVVVLFTPVFILPGAVVGFVGVLMGNLYLKAQLSVKREKSNARSPLLAHLSAAIQGLVSIRAYGAQPLFKEESLRRIDYYSRAARISDNLNMWISVRIESLGAVFTSALAAFLIYGRPIGAGNTGFSLSMAHSFTMFIFWMIRIYNELEVESNSLERIQGYIDIEHEVQPTESGKPPAAWPTSGDLRVERLSARYSSSGPKVLHDISFHVKSGERIGIVGRTGSGKSSLTLALLRCILTEGTVYFDGVPTNTINLDALRSNISIIPQTPELISGTLRQNLDPFDQNDDATLHDALRAAGLFSLQDAPEGRITLDTKVSGGGGNFSVGQRQIIALARAMVRGSKLLILDEATSAIDYKTDSVIQSTLRSQLASDVTVLTVAHRLQTIMDADKIMVLDSGRIVEFDNPKVLLEKADGVFKGLVDGSGDQKTLYELAGG